MDTAERNCTDGNPQSFQLTAEQRQALDLSEYRAFTAGDIAAFERLVLRYKNALILYISRIVKTFDAAEDLAQDTFVDLYLHKGAYDIRASLQTYLYSIAHHKAVDYIRKNQRIVLTEEVPEDIEALETLEDTVLRKEDNAAVLRCLRRLKPEYRGVLQLVEFSGMSYAQTAKCMAKSESQIKILVYRARKSLAREYRKSETGGRDEKRS